jgi:hypothetical protein
MKKVIKVAHIRAIADGSKEGLFTMGRGCEILNRAIVLYEATGSDKRAVKYIEKKLKEAAQPVVAENQMDIFDIIGDKTT